MNKIVLYLAIGYIGGAAYVGRATAAAPVPDVDEQTLQKKYHIAPTEGGLIGALRHQEVVVRKFAAIKLAYDGSPPATRSRLDQDGGTAVHEGSVTNAKPCLRSWGAEVLPDCAGSQNIQTSYFANAVD